MAIDKNADFTPSIPDSGVVPVKSPYNPTGSFKFWAQKVLPLVYDDSLSYYEVLCKVVNYLNNVIQNVDNLNDSVNSTNQSFETLKEYVNTTKNTLISTYNELQDYVNTYFDNLDVQQEINAKLDAMADSGELTTLLAPFIPDLVTQWLNQHVTPTSPVIDNTLSISGAGADAKVTGDKFNDISVVNPTYSLAWEIGKNVGADGVIATDVSKALSGAIYCNPGDLYIRNTPTYDNNNKTLIVYVNEYNGQTWLRRTTVPLMNPKLVIGQDTNNIRIGFGRNSADGAISSDVISTYYKDVFYRHAITDEGVKALDDNVKEVEEKLNVVNPTYSLAWEIGKNVNSSGAISTDVSKALSGAIYCNPGDLYIRNTPTYDNNNKTLIVYVNEYNGQTWLRRTTVVMSNPKLVIGQETNNIRVGFGRNAADGAISSDDISTYYKDVFYRHAITNEGAFIMRGDITSLGFNALEQCVSSGIYTFTTAQISQITDMPVQITTGGYLKVFVSSDRMWQELITPVHHLIRYSTGVWTDAEKYIMVSYDTGSGVDSSTERINIDIPRRGNIREYIRYKMGHCIDTDVNSNVWRLCYIYNVSTAGSESLMTTRGEFECAIHLADRDDFSGGIVHGDEVDEQVTFLVDGKTYTVDNIPPVCREFSIIRNSNLYDPSDSSLIIAKHGIEYKYTAKGLVIKQSIKWVGDHSLTNCYLAMFPIKKAYSTYRFDDTSFEVAENDQTSYGVFINNAKMVTEFNGNFTSSMSINEYPKGLPGGDRARVTDNSGLDYNKIYFVICNSGTVSDGDMWKSETVYEIA